jgi:hypothetical protein
MNTEQFVFCKLGGYVDSHPEIISSYPRLEITPDQSKELLLKCLPIGSKVGDFIIDKYNKSNLISYVFKNKEGESRDDLLSFSMSLEKNLNLEIYKTIIIKFFNILEKARLLSELVLKKYEESIFKALNQESDVEIEQITIKLSEMFKSAKEEFIKPKPKIKGSFF